jgi:acetyl-CoA carboxylase / biotin carboxylase 1
LDVENDRDVATWIEDNHKQLDSKLKKLKGDAVKQTLAKLFKSDIKNTTQGLAEIMTLLPAEEKEQILKLLK